MPDGGQYGSCRPTLHQGDLHADLYGQRQRHGEPRPAPRTYFYDLGAGDHGHPGLRAGSLSNWTGAVAGNLVDADSASTTIDIPMAANTDLVANFAYIEYNLNITIDEPFAGGGAARSCDDGSVEQLITYGETGGLDRGRPRHRRISSATGAVMSPATSIRQAS